MKRMQSKALLFAAPLLLAAGVAAAQSGSVIYVDQGADWPAQRIDFYTRDQGSQMIPLAWLRALKTPDGQPFLGDGLARYGYLPNPASAAGLPVGFTSTATSSGDMAGMTCAACHTRQIVVDDQAYRIDGGPAITDFQAYLTDLDTAVGAILDDNGAFDAFAAAVLGGGASKPASVAALRKSVNAWYKREHAWVSRSVPTPDLWGIGRLDAVSMIFNRLAGLDLGPPPSYMIEDNIKIADAPVRYPFLWNAPRQDYTQWPGFSPNGNALLGLSRNSGEVYGVFGTLHPRKDVFGAADLHSVNSANFKGLNRLEGLLWKMGPPKWPWPLDTSLLAHGAEVYRANCGSCHEIRPGEFRSFDHQTWATPIQDVGTDSREYDVVGREVATGVLQGTRLPIPIFSPRIQPREKAISLLGVTVFGSILQHPLDIPLGTSPTAAQSQAGARKQLTDAHAQWQQAAQARLNASAAATTAAASFKYESRVMQGIWAAAPYLHNGSVPTLAALLMPPDLRPSSFAVGRYYDRKNIGLATDQHGTGRTRATTGCDARNSGNSRCGHDFGTNLSPGDKRALLEYLKSL